MSALFRLYDYESGEIRRDDMISKDVGTRVLRSSISVIPQVIIWTLVICGECCRAFSPHALLVARSVLV